MLFEHVLRETQFLEVTAAPLRWGDVVRLVAEFHDRVNTTLFPNNPDQLLYFAQNPDDHLEMALEFIAPVPVGVPCAYCDPPATGTFTHFLQLLDSLSRPHTQEAMQANMRWQTAYPYWKLPVGFSLETTCLYLEEEVLTEAPYTALPDVIRHALGCTGNWFLDACPHCWFEDMEAWTWPHTLHQGETDVTTLTALWTEARPQWDAIRAFYGWLHHDPALHVAQTFQLLVDTYHAATRPTPLLHLNPAA